MEGVLIILGFMYVVMFSMAIILYRPSKKRYVLYTIVAAILAPITVGIALGYLIAIQIEKKHF